MSTKDVECGEPMLLAHALHLESVIRDWSTDLSTHARMDNQNEMQRIIREAFDK